MLLRIKMLSVLILLNCTASLAAEPEQLPKPLSQILAARPQPWERRSAPILSTQTTKQDWCKVVLYSPHVIFHAGKYRMWNLGTSTATRTNNIVMGYAESEDGMTWLRNRRHVARFAVDGRDPTRTRRFGDICNLIHRVSRAVLVQVFSAGTDTRP